MRLVSLVNSLGWSPVGLLGVFVYCAAEWIALFHCSTKYKRHALFHDPFTVVLGMPVGQKKQKPPSTKTPRRTKTNNNQHGNH